MCQPLCACALYIIKRSCFFVELSWHWHEIFNLYLAFPPFSHRSSGDQNDSRNSKLSKNDTNSPCHIPDFSCFSCLVCAVSPKPENRFLHLQRFWRPRHGSCWTSSNWGNLQSKWRLWGSRQSIKSFHNLNKISMFLFLSSFRCFSCALHLFTSAFYNSLFLSCPNFSEQEEKNFFNQRWWLFELIRWKISPQRELVWLFLALEERRTNERKSQDKKDWEELTGWTECQSQS